jgi:predicted amino acid racemase
VRELVDGLRRARHSKIVAGLKQLEAPSVVKLNNLAAAECSSIRLFFQGTLARYEELEAGKAAAGGGVGGAGGGSGAPFSSLASSLG